jgi:hypothetical protein
VISVRSQVALLFFARSFVVLAIWFFPAPISAAQVFATVTFDFPAAGPPPTVIYRFPLAASFPVTSHWFALCGHRGRLQARLPRAACSLFPLESHSASVWVPISSRRRFSRWSVRLVFFSSSSVWR